jgi:DNA-binding HxlR family transcriptional regulator
MAANRINRGILRELTKGPIGWTGGRQAEITPAGFEMLFVTAIEEAWLKKAPGGAVELDSEEGQAAINALHEGWNSTAIHRLAAEPLTLTELGRTLDTMSREDVAATVEEMKGAGLLEAQPSDGEGAAYAVTDWLRHGIAPVAAAASCERRHLADDTPPVEPLDVEAGLLLILPLVHLPAELAGQCRLVVELPESEERPAAGAMVRVEGGRIVSCASDLEGSADASAMGDQRAWFEAIIEGMAEDLQFGGEETLARELLEALHRRLFRTR